jgi:hypothetical protein
VPETLAKGKALGLDGFRFYFLGRGGVLGDVEAPVVASAFGYFNPALVADMWDSGKAILAPREAARSHFACSAELGRRHFSDLDGLPEFCAAADAINNAADSIGLALYSGFRAEPMVDDLPGRAMQLVTVLREFRGSAHLISVRGYGLDAKAAHFMRRPNDIGMFGWADDDAPEIGEAEREKLARPTGSRIAWLRSPTGSWMRPGNGPSWPVSTRWKQRSKRPAERLRNGRGAGNQRVGLVSALGW